MPNSSGQDELLGFLERQLVGPWGGHDEVIHRSPVYAYLTGMIFPVEEDDGSPPDEEAEAPAVSGAGVADLGRDDPQDGLGEDDDDAFNLTAATGWVPSAMGLSCLHNATRLHVEVRAATYKRDDDDDRHSGESPSSAEMWRRHEMSPVLLEIEVGSTGSSHVWDGAAQIHWRSRQARRGDLLTVSFANNRTVKKGEARKDPEKVFFQVQVTLRAEGGEFLPYPDGAVVNASDEDRELAYQYRNQPSFAVGHGVATTWPDERPVTWVQTTHLPAQLVPPVKPDEQGGVALEMGWLADESRGPRELGGALREVFAPYGDWIGKQRERAEAEVPPYREIAGRIVGRLERALDRIHAGIALVETNESVRRAFHIANQAMALQARNAGNPSPAWRPFQLGFILLALPSTTQPDHIDRHVVDLLWFPTGGGKTEAYLGLAAIEMVRRRLDRGYAGGGTAVITRYTMRLLTAQQFQRSARLICALEIVRRSHPTLKSTPEFSIGLLLGFEATPASYQDAADRLRDVYNQQTPENPFQVRSCPWCHTPLLPRRRTSEKASYGFVSSKHDFLIRCVSAACPFNERLPLQVVDEGIFENPPSIVLATVDKFARLAWIPDGGSIFGLGGVPFDPPSLVIQDELHLISGPLGTIVGIYEAAFRTLLAWRGPGPKTVASTATIRAADQQVGGLMASQVQVFPPSGLDADDSHFARADYDAAGRLYIGTMPQAFTPAWSIGQLAARLLAAPTAIPLDEDERDAYWTLVLYHNSLRELGRTVPILRDDVSANLDQMDRHRAGRRHLSPDGVVELTSNVRSHELVELLERLGLRASERGAIDAVVATNILSVGIDVPRLGIMLVNGQPKTTSEYIQATSRVGRSKVPGIVMTLYRSGKPRDRSTFESFRNYHGALYKHVEPTSVTPWTLQARRRAARAALVIVLRHGVGLRSNDDAQRIDRRTSSVAKALKLLESHIRTADPREADEVMNELSQALATWESLASDTSMPLRYDTRSQDERRLLKTFGTSGEGWPTMHSMRSVDKAVPVRPKGERYGH